MSGRKSGHGAKVRVCRLCDVAIAEKRPVWLLSQPSGAIMGPYHSGCSAKLAALYAKSDERARANVEGAEKFGQLVREETLPE